VGAKLLLVRRSLRTGSNRLTFLRDVGFLRYWTISNLPLFLLAAPMLWLLCHSSLTVMHALLHRPTIVAQSNRTSGSGVSCDSSVCHYPQLALPQFVLAVAAATTFHVQIINRLCSAYPIWYLVVAFWTTKRRSVNGKVESNGVIQYAVRGLIMYSMVQGMLFASFLPPA
jgi:phosphatidylinositol glycan class V